MVRLNALGQSSIEVGDVRIGPEQPYLFAIALYLIVERGKKIPRQALVDLIWPDVKEEKHARQRFRQALLRLRDAGLPIAGEDGTLLLKKSAAQADFDSVNGPDAMRPGESLEFLPHYAPRISDRFLDWVETQRSRVHATVQRVFIARMQQARARGDWAEVDAVAAECLRLDPYNEEAVMAHAECAVMRGSKREALSILDGYMEALGSHVGTIGLPAKILRTRIAERLTDQRYAMISEQYFVGREASMELLLGLLREAKRGAGSAAFVWGEPGIGKTRLVQELNQVAALDGARVVSTKCHPTDAGRSLSAFADLVPVLKTLPGALGCSAQTLSLLQRLTDRNRSETLPTQEAGDAAFLAATIRRAVFDLVDAVADEGMLIMVIEDVHWLDGPSWAILSAMVEWSTTRTLLILMTSRTSHATEAKVADPDRGLHRHHLLPLAEGDSAGLLDRLTAKDANPLTDPMRAWSLSAAEGNPYYLRELVRHWVETQQSFGVPRSLAELIEARLNRLSSLALRVLQLCAAFGKHSTFERLEKATGYANHMLLDAIEELSAAVMLATESAGITAKHDLLATAALHRLGGTAIRLVHRQVATVLEAEIRHQHTAALMWDCAEHWQRAGETAHALATVRLCAEHLHAVGQVCESVELFEKALTICPTASDRFDTLVGLAASLKAIDRWCPLGAVITEAQLLAARLTKETSIGDYLRLLQLETEWRLRVALNSQVEALLLFARDASKQPKHRVQAIHLAIIQCSEEGRREDAHTAFQIVDEIEISANQPALIAHIRMIFHCDFGDVHLAVGQARTLVQLETEIGEPGSLARARLNAAHCYRRLGLMDEAKKLLEQNWAFALDHRLDAAAGVAAVRLALNAVQDEDFECADIWQDRATAYARTLDEKAYGGVLLFVRARIALQRGETGPAEDYLRAESAFRPGHFRHKQTVAAIRCQVELAHKRRVSTAELDSIASDFEQYCDLGQHDFFALNLYSALIAAGESNKAIRMLIKYTTSSRRDRGPLPPSLAAITSAGTAN